MPEGPRNVEKQLRPTRRPLKRLSFARVLAFRSWILLGCFQFFCLSCFVRFFLPERQCVRSPDCGFRCHFAKNRSFLTPRSVEAERRSASVTSERRGDLSLNNAGPLATND